MSFIHTESVEHEVQRNSRLNRGGGGASRHGLAKSSNETIVVASPGSHKKACPPTVNQFLPGFALEGVLKVGNTLKNAIST